MDDFYILTDRQFALIEPLLREERDPRGRKPGISDRHALEGALYIMREGRGWRAMPAEFGPWMAVFMRYKRWVERGVWWKILMRLQRAGAITVSISLTGDDPALSRRHAPGNGGRKNAVTQQPAPAANPDRSPPS